MVDELSTRRSGRRGRRTRTFDRLLAESVRWPFQTALEFPENPPAMPRMVSSRRPSGDIVFHSQKMQRAVRCESGYERTFFRKLDGLAEVLWFHEQAPRVQYTMGDAARRYHPDALVALRNGYVFVAEVKMSGDFALYETIRKMNALTEWAHARGRGVFLGNHAGAVGDFIDKEVPRAFRSAVLNACRHPSGMTAAEWRPIREWWRRKYGLPGTSLQAVVLNERLVVTTRPFAVRRATPIEASAIDLFVHRFGATAPVLPLSAPARGRASLPQAREAARA